MASERVEAVVTEIEELRAAFEAWCRSLSEEELGRPVPGSSWRVRDFISHLATIDRTVQEWFLALAGGGSVGEAMERQAEAGERFDIDRWNDAQVAERADWSLDVIFAEARETRAGVVAALRELSDEQLDESIRFGGDSKRPAAEIKLGDYLRGWAKHDPIHVNDMIRALPERRQDATVRGWLEDPVIGPLARGYAAQMGWEEA